MAEQLMTVDEIAFRLRVDKSTVFRLMPKLVARGLQRVSISRKAQRFRQSSFDALIKESAETGRPLV